MAKCYQYTADGYYAEEFEDYGLLPNNATYTAPQLQEGYIPRWIGDAWEQVEDHKGEQGYVDGKPKTITEYGPYPAGWSTTPPEPTESELCAQRIAEIKGELSTLDAKATRPMRAIVAGTASDDDRTAVVELDELAKTLRVELAALEGR